MQNCPIRERIKKRIEKDPELAAQLTPISVDFAKLSQIIKNMNEADYIGADGCDENGKKFISHEIQSPPKIYKGTG